MEPLIFDDVTVVRVEARETEANGHVFELLACNGGQGLPRNVSVSVTVTDGFLVGIGSEPVERAISRVFERRARTHPNEGDKLAALADEPLVFDSRHATR